MDQLNRHNKKDMSNFKKTINNSKQKKTDSQMKKQRGIGKHYVKM